MERRFLSILIVLILSCSLFADEFTWNNPAGGLYVDVNNWTPTGVPNIYGGDMSKFTISNSYTVTLGQQITTDILYLDGSDVTLDLAGFSFAALFPQESGRAVIVGDTTNAALHIINGPFYSREVVIGQQSDSIGNLILTGETTSWTTMFDEQWHGIWLGEYGDANLSIQDNARFYHGHGNSAFGSDSKVNVDVNGIDSEWYVDGQFDMSISGKTNVNITNGGLVEIGKLTMALYPASSAQINISGKSHESELHIRNDFETFTIGQQGSAAIGVYGSKIWNEGKTVLAEFPASSGILEIHQGSWVDCANSVVIGGSFESAGGSGEIKIMRDNPDDPNGSLFTPAHFAGQFVKVWPNGKITMDGGEFIAEYGSGLANPTILQGGTLQGNGMIWANVENHHGIVAPYDDSTNKLLDIGYNYSQDSGGTLKIKIGGIEPIMQYSHVRVTNPDFGNVSLDGMLEVELTDGFVPNYDDRFILIAARHLTGKFNNAGSKYIFPGGSFDIIYDSESLDSVVLTHYSAEPSCPKYPLADFNKDCKVNMIDFAVFAEEWLNCALVPDSYCD